MKAAVYRRYGPPEVVSIAEVDTPKPAPDQVLVRIHAASVTSGDARLRAFNIPAAFWLLARFSFGLTGPRRGVLGSDFAGEVMAIGEEVRRFRVGDRVFGMGLLDSHAEYRVISENSAVAPIPPNTSYEDAAAVVFGGTTALHFLDKVPDPNGKTWLVIGASGAVGVSFVQIARHLGAEVTGVTSGANADLVRSLGASTVIDYTRHDFRTNGKLYDVIVDTVGATTFAGVRDSLSPDGTYIPVVGGAGDMLRAATSATGKGQRIVAGTASETKAHVDRLAALVAAGALRAIIDSRFPLEEVAEAHRRVDSGRKRGSVVLDIADAA